MITHLGRDGAAVRAQPRQLGGVWMNLQTGYDLAVAELEIGKRVTREVEAA